MFSGLGDNRWIVYVLPGFISLFVAGFISDFPEIRDVMIPFVYVALTTLSAVIPIFFVHIYSLITNKSVLLNELPRRPLFVSSVFLTSIVVGFLFGVGHTSDAVSNWLRTIFGKNTVLVSSHTEPIRLLFREAYQPTFVEEFDGIPSTYINSKEVNIYTNIVLNDGKDTHRFHGVVHSYYGRGEKPQVYLSPACIEDIGGLESVKGPGIWVNLENAQSVSFTYQACSPCAAKLKEQTGHGNLVTKCPFN